MARKAKKISRPELSGDETARLMRGGRELPRRSGAVREEAPTEAADFELYEVAELVVGAGGLASFTITDNEKARVQALVDFVADAVSKGRLESPGERAQDYYTIPFFHAEVEQFSAICWGFIEFFSTGESINAGRLAANAAENLRRFLERMDDHDRKKTIAGLMAYIGELQTSGVLEATPSDRLARVAKLIGEAAEIVSADPAKYVPLFRDRQIDPETGKKPTALEWFDQVWKSRVDAGEAAGDDIRQSDFKFYEALASYQKSKGRKISDLLPPSPTRSKIQETEEERRRRLSAAGTERSRRSRQRRTSSAPK